MGPLHPGGLSRTLPRLPPATGRSYGTAAGPPTSPSDGPSPGRRRTAFSCLSTSSSASLPVSRRSRTAGTDSMVRAARYNSATITGTASQPSLTTMTLVFTCGDALRAPRAGAGRPRTVEGAAVRCGQRARERMIRTPDVCCSWDARPSGGVDGRAQSGGRRRRAFPGETGNSGRTTGPGVPAAVHPMRKPVPLENTIQSCELRRCWVVRKRGGAG
jgi:hypothetical protein